MKMKDLKKREIAINLKALSARMFYSSETIKEIYGKEAANAHELSGAAKQVLGWSRDILKELENG